MPEMPNGPLRLQDVDYPYLHINIRSDAVGIPEARANPISPLQMLASTQLIADGSTKVRSLWPFGRKARRREGMYMMGQGAQMAYQPVGRGTRMT